MSVLQGAKPHAWVPLRACPACSACGHQPGGNTYFWGYMLLPLPHARDGVALQSGREQESTKTLCLPSRGPC